MNRYIENILVLSSLLILYVVLQPPHLVLLRVVVGVLLLIAVPGGALIRMLNVRFSEDLFYGYSSITGLSLQLIFIGFGYMLWMNVFNMFIYTLIATAMFLALLSVKVRLLTVLRDLYLSFRKPTSILYIAAIVLSLYYILGFSYSSVATDGALYCDIARNIVLRGVFKTNVLNDILAHIGTPIAISIFLLLGGVSQVSANLTALYVSTLTIYPLIDFERRIVRDGLGVVSSILYVVHPMFTLFSSMLFGPEILNILYTLSALIFFTDSIYERSIGKSILAGLALTSLNACWGPETPATLLTLLITSIILGWRSKLINIKTSITIFPSIFILLWFYKVAHLWIPLAIISILILIYDGRNGKHVLAFYTTVVLASQLFLVRSIFEHPLTILEGTFHVFNFLSSINIDVLGRVGYYLSTINLWITPPLIVLTILYLTQIDSGVKAIPLIFIASHMLLYSLYFPLGWLERRFLLSAFLMMTLTSSSIINLASSRIKLRIKITRGSRVFMFKGLKMLSAICIIALLTLTYFTYQYQDVLKIINQSSTKQLMNIASEVISSVGEGEVISVYGPSRVFAWITDRRIVAIPRYVGLTDIYSCIEQYNATVLVIDVNDLPIEARSILSGGIVNLNSKHLNISLINRIDNFRIFRVYQYS